MLNYIELLKKELLEQFRGKENIEDLVEVLGMELQQIYDFLVQLRAERGLYTSVGKQLDGVGDIVDMSRADVYKYINEIEPTALLDDDIYRQYLIYKILKNTCHCTYRDIVKAFQMFWDRPLYYREDPNEPATMIFDTGEMEGNVDTRPLFRTPPIRAAGVTLKLYARTFINLDTKFYVLSGLGYASTITNLPNIELDYDFQSKAFIGSNFQSVSQDTLPDQELDYQFGFKLNIKGSHQSVSQDMIPTLERNISYGASVGSGSVVHSVMETPIGGIVFKE